jgi:tetratricopeptide (TPR) repeat protein
MAKYHEALQVDQENEYAMANISAIHLKKLEYEKSLEFATKAINVINNFDPETKLFSR